MKWYVVEQNDLEIVNHKFDSLKEAKEWLMEKAAFEAWNEWSWPCNPEAPDLDTVNEILTEMKAYNLFLTILPEPLLGTYNLKDWRKDADRSTWLSKS